MPRSRLGGQALRRVVHVVTLLVTVLVTTPDATAQHGSKPHRIGFLSHDVEPSPNSRSFLRGLRDLGYAEGRDFVMEYRWAEGRADRLPRRAAELVTARVDVIVTRGTAATLAAHAATRSIPIVFGSAGGPVEKGIAASLSRPGGNITGSALHVSIAKVLELLKEAVPSAAYVTHVYDPNTYEPKSYRDESLAAARSHAATLGMQLQSVALRERDSVPRLFEAVRRDTGALVFDAAGLVIVRRQELCRLAVERRVPAVGRERRFAESGCLASYGEDVIAMYHRAAYFVDKILKGAKPADLPIEQPAKLELVVNLTTAKRLGLTLPPALLLRADQVLE